MKQTTVFTHKLPRLKGGSVLTILSSVTIYRITAQCASDFRDNQANETSLTMGPQTSMHAMLSIKSACMNQTDSLNISFL